MKPVCAKCKWFYDNNCRCFHPERKGRDYVQGGIIGGDCYYYNINGQCEKFEPRLNWLKGLLTWKLK